VGDGLADHYWVVAVCLSPRRWGGSILRREAGAVNEGAGPAVTAEIVPRRTAEGGCPHMNHDHASVGITRLGENEAADVRSLQRPPWKGSSG
jgi:hypothetical protein